MADAQDPKFFDKRTVERYVRQGVIDEKALERYNKSLPDVADKAAPIETAMLDEVDDYDDEDEDETDEASDEG